MRYYNAIVIRDGALLKKTFQADNPEEALKMAKEDFKKRFGIDLLDAEIVIVKVPEEVRE